MKFITVIFNILITKSLCNPVYTYQLRGMYEKEKNMYFNNTVDAVFNQVHDIIISNAKQNINTTYFDFWYQYFFYKQQKNNNYGCWIYYEEQYNRLKPINFPSGYYYSYSDTLRYNIPMETYISKIIEMLSTNFPDCNLVKLYDPKSCVDIYLISW